MYVDRNFLRAEAAYLNPPEGPEGHLILCHECEGVLGACEDWNCDRHDDHPVGELCRECEDKDEE